MSSERVIRAATAPAPNSGSQTITSTNSTQPHPSSINSDLVLRLRGASSNDRKVKWDDDVIDNETLGKKKSKSMFLLVLPCSHIAIYLGEFPLSLGRKSNY